MNVNVRTIAWLAVAALLLGVGSPVYSQAPKPVRTNWREILDALDLDGDGEISLGELADLNAVAERILDFANKDGDEGLSAVELIEVREIAVQADNDRNGYVDRAELNAWLLAWRNGLALSGVKPLNTVKTAGNISLKTVLDVKRNGFDDFDVSNVAKAAQIIRDRFDVDKNQRLSAQELAPIQESLRDEDADGSGVSMGELIDWLVSWRRQGFGNVAPAASQPAPNSEPVIMKISLAVLLDGNKNGLTAFDLSNLNRATSRVMDQLDLDHNAILSPNEMQLVIESLAEADVDNNGTTRSELLDWIAAWRKQLKNAK